MRLTQGYSNAGIELVRKLTAEGKIIFTSAESTAMAISMNISLKYIRQVLFHLERAGWIIRLKYGLYSISSVIPGISPLHEFQIATALVQPAAISHWSALNYHGMTEQVPQRVFALTTAHLVPRLRGKKSVHSHQGYPIGSTFYKFVQIKSEYFFGITDTWVNESKVKVTDKERTCLDCLMFPEYAGGFYEVLSIFERNISKLDIEKLVQYALKLDTVTIKRLGWILEQQDVDLSRLKLLQGAPIKGYRLLDKTGLHKGTYNLHWMIQENLSNKVGL
jgi:predicted transcriptional regulator of viral defense system